WFFTKYLQDAFDAKLYFQMTDDEKFLIHPELTVKAVNKYTYENILDIIAVGFDPKKTLIISDTRCAKTLYNVAIRIAKHITFSTARAVFGFEDSSNIGIIFFPALQAVPAFLESIISKRNVPCLIPAAIDQDPYWRITRDVAPKLGFYKPAQIHCRFLPGLGKGGKMSASLPETCIFTTDEPETAEKKIMNAFTGGRATVEEQRKKGGNPNVCTVFQYMNYIFEEDDRKMEELYKRCRAGAVLCGECKEILAEMVKGFLIEHQEKREKARDMVEDFLADDKINIDVDWGN
ncbi:MAG: tryptophan--tRNA ligase, partial [Candidatus Bathyarchaeota archaeon]|nr:tryptophan--tRNA ligase [Candidatus Bathyarchaeota archaeon]